ncbi:hypothetical protein QQM79_20880 [Marinobacteraceae bacterium S3BR75-40.1]
MKSLQLNLTESDTRFVIESLRELEKKWAAICETSEDEDEISDYGNDLIELRLLIKTTEEQAIKTFGDGVVNFSREAL